MYYKGGGTPDTPWHIGYVKMDENDTKRHKSRCEFYCKGICKSIKSPYYDKKCGGSSHCMQYREEQVENVEKSFTSIVATKNKDIPSIDLLKSDKVFHKKYGTGIIEDIDVANDRIEIKFGEKIVKFGLTAVVSFIHKVE